MRTDESGPGTWRIKPAKVNNVNTILDDPKVFPFLAQFVLGTGGHSALVVLRRESRPCGLGSGNATAGTPQPVTPRPVALPERYAALLDTAGSF
ncbi:hypothetical protein CROQUDRAFT_92840 [Cronartium quercuum f. sp. fusiforme G11]|uniref:Uncharacterized protein n=1 Tax=Cronartium quercuum f. sp. fusiforme G11 TaxID=708437 RepID=A0A9P6TC53_9BASI|nr:hypothetical protein CROQUDRAFT_92840 [Cronartium quercuum f. sp. fusiforme G11]